MRASLVASLGVAIGALVGCGDHPVVSVRLDGSPPNEDLERRPDGALRVDAPIDLFVFRDGVGLDGPPPVLAVTIVRAQVDSFARVPDLRVGPGYPPFGCVLELSITNPGPPHASGVHLESMEVEDLGGGAKATAPALSVPHFDGVVPAGSTVSWLFQCATPYGAKFPFQCGDNVKLTGNLHYFGAAPVRVVSTAIPVDCPA